MTRVSKLYSGINSTQNQALYDAMMACAEDENMEFYRWLETMPKASLMVVLVDKLHEMGFDIVEKSEKTTELS